jgi:hypothetical protein
VPSVTFNLAGISGYTDLVIVSSIQSARAAQLDSLAVRFNGDTGNNYSYTFLFANTAEGLKSARGSNQSNIFIGNFAANSTANTFGTNILQINNYSNSTTFKTTISRSGSLGTGNDDTEATVGLWRNPAAITSVTLRSETGNNFTAGSTFTIYGIANADNFAKATGGMLYEDSTYWYHVFASNGTFTPKQALTCDYLVVAGGAGGGWDGGGGGGAGGLRSTVTATGGGGSLETVLSLLANTNYTVTIGAGGAGGTNVAKNGVNGNNSVFSSITSTGGGGGGGNANNGVAGGSGGGAGQVSTTTTGGSATPSGQGYAGGSQDGNNGGGGGGGAGAVGGSAVGTTAPGVGGAGVAISALAVATNTGVSNFYAGGGGGGAWSSGAGGAGGAGGGGAGGTASPNQSGFPATANTGGGGGGNTGGGVGAQTGGAGGSGVVIVRYLKA